VAAFCCWTQSLSRNPDQNNMFDMHKLVKITRSKTFFLVSSPKLQQYQYYEPKRIHYFKKLIINAPPHHLNVVHRNGLKWRGATVRQNLHGTDAAVYPLPFSILYTIPVYCTCTMCVLKYGFTSSKYFPPLNLV
jgi:hypothetical protein